MDSLIRAKKHIDPYIPFNLIELRNFEYKIKVCYLICCFCFLLYIRPLCLVPYVGTFAILFGLEAFSSFGWDAKQRIYSMVCLFACYEILFILLKRITRLNLTLFCAQWIRIIIKIIVIIGCIDGRPKKKKKSL